MTQKSSTLQAGSKASLIGEKKADTHFINPKDRVKSAYKVANKVCSVYRVSYSLIKLNT